MNNYFSFFLCCNELHISIRTRAQLRVRIRPSSENPRVSKNCSAPKRPIKGKDKTRSLSFAWDRRSLWEVYILTASLSADVVEARHCAPGVVIHLRGQSSLYITVANLLWEKTKSTFTHCGSMNRSHHASRAN